jgi:hypothetical protein
MSQSAHAPAPADAFGAVRRLLAIVREEPRSALEGAARPLGAGARGRSTTRLMTAKA